MKKFMRIALVFALAGATLVGCTKDYSGDISDLNKKVSEQQAAVTALQNAVSNAQAAADAAAATANTALSTAKAAATADELNAVKAELAKAATADALAAVDAKYAAYIPEIEAAAKAADLEALETTITAAIAATNVSIEDLKAALATKADKTEFDAAVERILALETDYIALEARVAALEAADEEIQKLIDANAKGIEANAEDIAALQELVEALTAQVEGNFSVVALTETWKFATYSVAKWNPGTTKLEKEYLAKLVKEFPELAEIEQGDKIESFGALPFIVNPSTTVLDDTYTFSLVNKKGEDTGIKLGNPSLGYAVKSGGNVWNIEVQSPSFNEKGKEVYAPQWNLSLVVESAAGVSAQTAFDYTVFAYEDTANSFQITKNDVNNFVFNGTNTFDAFEPGENGKAMFSFPDAHLYDNYFVIEADAADIEEFGIDINGSEIAFDKVPVAGGKVSLAITAVGVNGKTAVSSAELTFKGTIAPNAELADKEVTLAYNKNASDHYHVAVNYAVDDFGFSALEWKEIFKSFNGHTTNAVSAEDPDAGVQGAVAFYEANGTTQVNVTADGANYNKAKIMRIYVDAQTALPGTYTINISDGALFCSEGSITIKNPEACPIKLIDALCEDGVLQIVGNEPTNNKIEYELRNALVFDTNEATLQATSFYDEDQTSSDVDNWVKSGTTFSIPVATPAQNLLYTPRNFSVKFTWFNNSVGNEGKFDFQAEAVSPIYAEGGKGVVTVTSPTIYLGGKGQSTGEYTSVEVNKIVNTGKYVAGDKVGKKYNVFQGWKENPAVPKTFLHTYTAAQNNYSGVAVPAAQQHWGEGSNSVVDGDQLMIDNNGDFIKIDKTGNILRGFGLSNNEILTVQTAEEPLYLTDRMANTAGGRWTLYNDNYGKPRAAKLSNGKKVYGQAWEKYVNKSSSAATVENCAATVNNLTGKTEDLVKSTIASELGLESAGEINDIYEKVCSEFIFEEDKNAVAAYNVLKPSFRKITTIEDPDAPASKDAEWVQDPDVSVAGEIASVRIGFADPVTAETFIESVAEITDAYSSSHSCTVEVNPNATFQAGLTSVDLPAYIKISDKWGMTMEIPFTVTVKVASE